MGFVGSHLWQLRQVWGPKLLLAPGVSGVVTRADGKVLMGHRTDNNRWGFISGYMEPGDSAESAFARELQEETGLTCTDVQMIGVVSDPQRTLIRHTNGDEAQSLTLVFTACCEIEDAPQPADEEHFAFEWVTAEEAGKRVRPQSITWPTFAAWQRTRQFQIG